MKRIMGTASLAAMTILLAGGMAHAKSGLCKLTGNYSDNFGSTTSIQGKSGSILNTALCATAYTFKVSDETAAGFTVKGKNSTKSCGKFSADLTFQGSCSVFMGTATVNGNQISDTFTKENTNSVRHVAPTELTTGLH